MTNIIDELIDVRWELHKGGVRKGASARKHKSQNLLFTLNDINKMDKYHHALYEMHFIKVAIDIER